MHFTHAVWLCECNSAGVTGNSPECLLGNEKDLAIRTEKGEKSLQEVYFSILLYY